MNTINTLLPHTKINHQKKKKHNKLKRTNINHKLHTSFFIAITDIFDFK